MKKCAQTWSKKEDEEKSQLQSKSCIQLTDVFCCTFACYYNVYATISMSTNAINVVIPWKQTQKRVSWNNLEWMSSKKNSVKRGTQGKEFFTASTEPQEKKESCGIFYFAEKSFLSRFFSSELSSMNAHKNSSLKKKAKTWDVAWAKPKISRLEFPFSFSSFTCPIAHLMMKRNPPICIKNKNLRGSKLKSGCRSINWFLFVETIASSTIHCMWAKWSNKT